MNDRISAFLEANKTKICEAIFAENGIESELSDDGYLIADLGFGSGEKTVGLFTHADVVPAGDGWTLTEPFEPIEKSGVFVGRGIRDNKSGMVGALFTALAILELGLPMQNRLRVFVGSNEESGMEDIMSFVRTHGCPDVSIVPDSGFPVSRGEKGILRFWATARESIAALDSLSGGEAFNIVLKDAEATVSDSAIIAHLREFADANPLRGAQISSDAERIRAGSTRVSALSLRFV